MPPRRCLYECSRHRKAMAARALLMGVLAALAGCAQPGESKPKPPPELAVRYVCNDNTRFMAYFVFEAPRRVRIERPHQPLVELPEREISKGFLYTDGQGSFTGFGDEAVWQAAGAASTHCLTKGPPPPYFPGAAIARPTE
jgi:hypothetical protein